MEHDCHMVAILFLHAKEPSNEPVWLQNQAADRRSLSGSGEWWIGSAGGRQRIYWRLIGCSEKKRVTTKGGSLP